MTLSHYLAFHRIQWFIEIGALAARPKKVIIQRPFESGKNVRYIVEAMVVQPMGREDDGYSGCPGSVEEAFKVSPCVQFLKHRPDLPVSFSIVGEKFIKNVDKYKRCLLFRIDGIHLNVFADFVADGEDKKYADPRQTGYQFNTVEWVI